jgi:hypothetical protein
MGLCEVGVQKQPMRFDVGYHDQHAWESKRFSDMIPYSRCQLLHRLCSCSELPDIKSLPGLRSFLQRCPISFFPLKIQTVNAMFSSIPKLHGPRKM